MSSNVEPTVAATPTTFPVCEQVGGDAQRVVKRWQGSLVPAFWIFAIVWLAFLVQWFVVVDGLVYLSSWPRAKLAWQIAVLVLPSLVTASLWSVHYLDPGVIPPRDTTDPEVLWYENQSRPVVLGERFTDADGTKRAVRFAKDFRGQTTKTIIPEELIHPEDPEGPLLADHTAPEFNEKCWTVRHCSTCRVWRPPRASHCQVCGHCMARFDHHCPVVGTCIAQRNMRWFVSMFVTGGIACAGYFAGAVVRMMQVCDEELGVGRSKCHGTWEVITLSIYSAALLWGAIALLGAGAGYFFEICADMTTKERLGKKPPGFTKGLGEAGSKHWSGKTAAGGGKKKPICAAAGSVFREVCCAPVRFRPRFKATRVEDKL